MLTSNHHYVVLDRNISLEAVRVTEAAAIAAYHLMGKGDENGADALAVNAMRTSLNSIDIRGTIVIGEGERDEAPMLYIGEQVGSGKGPELDIAVDPLEGTNILATGGNNSLSVLAIGGKGSLLKAPDVYMDKVAIGFFHPTQIIDIDNSPETNLHNIASVKNIPVSDLVVTVLDRPRHEELIAAIRKTGASIRLIKDGDIAAVIATSMPESGIDVYMGIGGAPEGVIAAAALQATGGQMSTKLLFRNDDEKQRAYALGITDLSRKYNLSGLASKDVMFAATGVTDGSILNGIKSLPNGAITNSIVMRAKTGTIRKIETYHNFSIKS